MSMPAVDIQRMSPQERLKLIEDLWESLQADPDTLQLPESHRAELDRRIEDMDKNPADSLPWEDVQQHLRLGRIS